MIKNKEEKEKTKDIEIAEDGRIIKINNWESEKIIYCPFYFDIKIKDSYKETTEQAINLGLVYATQEAKDRAIFNLKIETKLKNIAERLNNGRQIDWENALPYKYFIYYIQSKENQSEEKILLGYDFKFKRQGAIYSLDKNFLEVAKKEIGEANLIKYFKES